MIKYISKQEFQLAYSKGLLFTDTILPSLLKIGDKLSNIIVNEMKDNFISLDGNCGYCCQNGSNYCIVLTQITEGNFECEEYRITDFYILSADDIKKMTASQARNELEWHELESRLSGRKFDNLKYVNALKKQGYA